MTSGDPDAHRSLGALPPVRTIVDGNNVIGSRPDGWWRDRAGATRRLVQQLGKWAVRMDHDVLVVFDGPRRTDLPRTPRVDVRFAEHRSRDAADDVIAALIAGADDRTRLSVVTSDRGLANRVRAYGVTVLGARELRDQLDDSATT